MTADPRFYQHRRQRGHTPPPRDELAGLAERIWHQRGEVYADPASIEAAGDWVTAQTMVEWAEKRFGKRRG